MKKFLLLIFICFTQNIFSQTLPPIPKDSQSYTIVPPEEPTPSKTNDNVTDNQIYPTSVVEIKPEFPGGDEAFKIFIKENYKNTDPTAPKGKIYVSFIIEKDGSLSDISIIRDFGFGSGQEAIRILKKSPKWSTGKQNGKDLRVKKLIRMDIE